MSDTYTSTICTLCQKHFEIPADLLVPTFPEPLDKRTEKLIEVMIKHVQKRHSEVLSKIGVESRELFGLQVLRCFEHENESLLQRMEATRIALHRQVAVTVSDAALQHNVAGLGLQEGDAEKVLAFCKQLRGALTETV